jgi:two-component system, LuxR family, sensor kinase FixL
MASFVHKATGRLEIPLASPAGMELSDFATESVIVRDERGVIQYWNAASEVLYGWPAIAMIGQNIETLRVPDAYDAEPTRTLQREGRWDGVVRRRHLDGTEVAAAVRQIVRRDATGNVFDIVEFGRNAGTLPEAADCASCELRASEERYRNLIQYLPTALWQVDSRRVAEIFDQLKANGVRDVAAYLDKNRDLIRHAGNVVRVTEVNRDAVSLFRANTSADLLKPIRYLFAAAPGLARRVMAAHFDGRRNFIEETRILTFDGTMIDVLFTVTYPRPPEQLDTTFITMQDISERLNAEKQLRKLQADFTHAGRIATLGELATSIAHEINQPLAAIVMNGETSLRWLARSDQNTEKVTELTSRIVSNARRASEIIQRIRGMAAKQEPEKGLIDFNEIVEEALLFIRHDVESKLITLSTTFRSELPRVMGDRIQLQQVIINLLVNSVQAITQSGQPTRRIDIETSIDEDGSVVFSVFDNGPGIAEADLTHIFDSFFSTKDAGIGIGLAICQSIIAAHGGKISGSNRANGGAHFRFTLPVPTVVGTSGVVDFMRQTQLPI